MFKWIILMVFTTFMAIINAPNSIVLFSSEISNIDEAVEALAEVQSHEVLPVVLFETKLTETTYTLQIPKDLLETTTMNRKMTKRTIFSTSDSEKQIFFCPKQNSNEKCLAPREFDNNELLRCSEEPTPVVMDNIPNEISCSSRGPGSYLSMGYDICPREEPYKYEKWEFKLYKFCYDTEKKKTLYTFHYILSPKLIKSRLLYREQQCSYPYSVQNAFGTANLPHIASSLDSEMMSFFEAIKPMYRVQKLVPSEDMALGTWIKTTYQFVNAQLQNKWLFSFWNEVNDKVREEAIRMYNNHGVTFSVATGVFDLNKNISEGEEQIYNMWVKVVTSISEQDFENVHAVAFLMNNFIEFYSDEPELVHLQIKILKYCRKDLCVDSFKRRVHSRVLCCQTTEKIAKLFHPEIIKINLPLLQIPGLTEIPT